MNPPRPGAAVPPGRLSRWKASRGFRYNHNFVRATGFCLFLLVFAAGCGTAPESYPPPAQRETPPAQSATIRHFVAMNDPNAASYILRDVSEGLEANSWRWAFRRPELRFFLHSSQHLKFVMDFAIPEHTFKETGPVTLSVFINGQLLDRFRCTKPGRRQLEKEVPPELLKAGALNLVAIEPDKVWVSKEDGATLGFILASAGFQE